MRGFRIAVIASRRDEVLKNLTERLQHRKVGISRMRYFCIVPSATKSGDTICILHGGQLPCVLREAPATLRQASNTSFTAQRESNEAPSNHITYLVPSHRYQFIGGCFFEGDIQGEALETCLKLKVEPVNVMLV